MPKRDAPALEHLQADLIFLMNHYTGRPCRNTAGAITQVLQGILDHPLIELFPELRCQCARGLNQWRLRAGVEAACRNAPLTASLH